MSVQPYRVFCSWPGCLNTALPNPEMPSAPKVCAEHVEKTISILATENKRMATTVEYRQTVIEAPHTPLALKPGRWVPWLLFALWVGLTAIEPTMLLWWGIFMPIAFLGHHFGMGEDKSRNSPGSSRL